MSADPNPLDRLTPEELHEAFGYYVQRCRDLRLQIGQLLDAHAVASGLPPKENVLDWHSVGPLGDIIDDANSFLPDLEERSISISVNWLEHVVWLKGQLEGALDQFSVDAEDN